MVASGEEAGVGTACAGPGVKFAPLAGVPLFVGVGAESPIDEDEPDARGRVSLFYHF